MNTKEQDKAKKLFFCIGDIDDIILDEADIADIAAETAATRKKYVKYGTVAAAASFGVALTTFLLIRSRRVAANAS